jgi:hypothetical protein
LTDKARTILDDVAGSESFAEASAAAVNNAKHHASVRDDIETILAHPLFESILSEDPLGIGNAGHKNVFLQEEFDQAMTTVGLYECACNFWWQSFKPNQAAVNIPVNSRAVTNLANHWFPKAPDTMPFIIIVAAHPGLKVLANSGELIRVSPPETVHAFLQSCAEACRTGANAVEMDKWRRAMHTVTFRFEVILTQNDLYWRAANLREMVVSEYRAVALTPVQRICQVIEFKAAQERKAGGRLSSEMVAKLFLENLKMSEDSEKLSKNLVDNILTVWARALSQPAVLALV